MPSASRFELRCLRCGGTQTVSGYDPSRSYRCVERDCGGDLADPADAKTVRVDTPADISRAAADPRNVIGKYVLLRELGRGGMGAVYKAWDSTLKRWVALKFLLLPGSDEDLQRFQREAETAAGLKHPNIAAIYEVGEAEGKPYLAMEHVEGRGLHGLKLKVPRACEIMRQVALALAYAHGRSIIHRDLKPGNIMLGAGDKPTVLDFGLAKSMKDATRLTLSGMVVGTPCYMSPEQAEGRVADVGPRSDIYQLGAVLYELVTGRAPFRGENAAQILRRVVDEDLVPPSRLASVPADVETIILRAMEKEPARRYPSAQAFADELGRWLRGEPIVARRASTVERLKRGLRRHRTALGVGVATLGVALGVGGYFAASRASERDGHLWRGNAAWGRGEFEKAHEDYTLALALDRENAEIGRKLEDCNREIALLKKRRIEAEEARNRAEKAAADEKARSGHREAARPAYERGMAELDEAVKDLYRQGADLVKTRARLLSSVEAFTESLSKWPENPDALFARGRARALRFEGEEADRDFARAAELRADFAAARTERGKLLLQRYIEARMHAGWLWSPEVARPFEKWKETAQRVSADPAWSAFAEDRMEECLRVCDARLKEKREQEELWKLRGDACFLRAGVVTEGNASPDQERLLAAAIESYSEAIRLRPNYYEARMMRGYLEKKRGQSKPSLEDMGVALQLRPDDALACCFMGLSTADAAKALEWIEKGIQARPDSFICRMNRAGMLFQQGKVEEARAELERSMALNPDHYYPIFLRGAIRLKGGDLEGACQDFRKATERGPEYPSAWYYLGVTAFNLKRWAEAVTALEQALRLRHSDRSTIEDLLRKARQELR